MADPQAAQLTQLRNIQTRIGKSIADLHQAVAASGLTKTGERRSWLMEHFKLGYGDANAVALSMGKPLPDLGAEPSAGASPAVASQADPLDSLYTGAKAHLRPVHEAVMQFVRTLGSHEAAPKKTYVSLRRKKQFAMVGPATRDSVEIGLNLKGLTAHPRLTLLPPGGMCQATLRIGSAAEVDAQLEAWLKQAFDAAG
jgi:hypothetical protein